MCMRVLGARHVLKRKDSIGLRTAFYYCDIDRRDMINIILFAHLLATPCATVTQL